MITFQSDWCRLYILATNSHWQSSSWVEAMEKPREQDAFLKCVLEKATHLNEEGKVEVDFKPGFGLKVDEQKLISLADAHLKI